MSSPTEVIEEEFEDAMERLCWMQLSPVSDEQIAEIITNIRHAFHDSGLMGLDYDVVIAVIGSLRIEARQQLGLEGYQNALPVEPKQEKPK